MQSPELLKDMLVLYGSVIIGLLAIIAWTLKRFVDGYDTFKQDATHAINNHETRISILEK